MEAIIIKKTFSIKMIVYAGMSRSIKYVNNVRMGNSRNKINKPIPYNPTLVHSYFVFCSLLTCT